MGITKDIKTAISSTLGASVAVVTSTAQMVTTVAGSTTDIVEPTVGMFTDVAETGRSYTATFLAETQADSAISQSIATSRLEEAQSYLASEAGKKKLQEASKKYVESVLAEALDF